MTYDSNDSSIEKWNNSTNDNVPGELKPSMIEVDELADELVAEYANPDWRPWYCGVVMEFGPATVQKWRTRCRNGTQPARLFSFYVNNARKHGAKHKPDGYSLSNKEARGIDDVYNPTDIELQNSHKIAASGIDEFLASQSPGKAIPWMAEDE